MGWGKYNEDNEKINEDRRFMREGSEFRKARIVFNTCPYCKKTIKSDLLNHHIITQHNSSSNKASTYHYNVEPTQNYVPTKPKNLQLSLFCNYKKYTSNNRYNIPNLHSMMIECDPNIHNQIVVWFNDKDIKTTINTEEYKYKYNLYKYLKDSFTNRMTIQVGKDQWTFLKELDVHYLDNFDLKRRTYDMKYVKRLLTNDLITDSYALRVAKLYKLNNQSMDKLYDRFEYYHYAKNNKTEQLYLFYNLATKQIKLQYEDYCNMTNQEWSTLQLILYGSFEDAAIRLNNAPRSNNKNGLIAIIGCLTNDINNYKYSKAKYKINGFIGELFKIVEFFCINGDTYNYEEAKSIYFLLEDLDILNEFPLLNALNELNNHAIMHNSISEDVYNMLYKLCPLVTLLYALKAKSDCERILKIGNEVFPESLEIKRTIIEKDYSWAQNVLSGELTKQELQYIKNKNKEKYGRYYLSKFPFDSSIKVKDISRKGYNGLLITIGDYKLLINCGAKIELEERVDAILLNDFIEVESGLLDLDNSMITEVPIYGNEGFKPFVDSKEYKSVDWYEDIYLNDDIYFKFIPACNNATSAIIHLTANNKSIVIVDSFKNHGVFNDIEYDLLPVDIDYLILNQNFIDIDHYDKQLVIDQINESNTTKYTFEINDLTSSVDLLLVLKECIHNLEEYHFYLSNDVFNYVLMTSNLFDGYHINTLKDYDSSKEKSIIISTSEIDDLPDFVKFKEYNAYFDNTGKNIIRLDNKASQSEIKQLIAKLNPKVISILGNKFEKINDLENCFIQQFSGDLLIKQELKKEQIVFKL